MNPQEAQERIKQLVPRLGLEISDLQQADTDLINLLSVPVLIELSDLMSRAAKAIQSKDIYRQGLAYTELKQEFAKRGVMIMEDDSLPADNLASLVVDGPHWILKIAERASTPNSEAIREFIHELGAYKMMKILMEHVTLENPQEPTDNDLKLLKSLLVTPTGYMLDENDKKRKLAATHIIDGVFWMMLEE